MAHKDIQARQVSNWKRVKTAVEDAAKQRQQSKQNILDKLNQDIEDEAAAIDAANAAAMAKAVASMSTASAKAAQSAANITTSANVMASAMQNVVGNIMLGSGNTTISNTHFTAGGYIPTGSQIYVNPTTTGTWGSISAPVVHHPVIDDIDLCKQLDINPSNVRGIIATQDHLGGVAIEVRVVVYVPSSELQTCPNPAQPRVRIRNYDGEERPSWKPPRPVPQWRGNE